MSQDKLELPLGELLKRLRDAADVSIGQGYVTQPLLNYINELHQHSSVGGKDLTHIAFELQRFGRLNSEDIPTVLHYLQRFI
jgi:hypothetical protein